MTNNDDELSARKVVLLRDVTKTLPLSMTTLRQRMREANIPEVNLGPRKTGLFLRDLDTLLARCTVTPTKEQATNE